MTKRQNIIVVKINYLNLHKLLIIMTANNIIHYNINKIKYY